MKSERSGEAYYLPSITLPTHLPVLGLYVAPYQHVYTVHQQARVLILDITGDSKLYKRCLHADLRWHKSAQMCFSERMSSWLCVAPVLTSPLSCKNCVCNEEDSSSEICCWRSNIDYASAVWAFQFHAKNEDRQTCALYRYALLCFSVLSLSTLP